MKKVFFLFLFIFLIFGNINLNAQYFDGNPLNYKKAFPITEENFRFNVIKGLSDKETLESSNYIIALNNDVSHYCYNGNIFASVSITNDGSSNYLDASYTFEDGIATYGSISFDERCIYEFKYDNGYELLVCNELNLISEFSSFDKCYLDYYTFNYTINDNFVTNDFYCDSTMQEVLFSCLYGIECNENQQYIGSDVYFVTSYTNPISINQVLNYISVSDYTDGNIADFSIVNSNYDPTKKLEISNYSFDIVAKDIAGNTTIQTCNISVVDVIKPTITANDKSCTYKYPIAISESDFIAYDDNGIEKIEIIEDNYTPNKNIPGKYNVTARAYDMYGNYNDCTMIVSVLDKYPPVLKINSLIQTTTLEPITIDDIKKEIYIVDEIDGVIDKYNIIDSDGYLNNPKRHGTFKFIITYSDNAGNSNNYTYNLVVSDDDYPIITLQNILVVDDKEVLSKDEIVAMLRAMGEIIDDDAEISSLYFDSSNPTGEYNLTILSNGNEMKYKIIAGQNNIIDYSPAINNKDNNINIGLIIGIIMMVGTISVLGIIVYKKRH